MFVLLIHVSSKPTGIDLLAGSPRVIHWFIEGVRVWLPAWPGCPGNLLPDRPADVETLVFINKTQLAASPGPLQAWRYVC